MTRGSWVERIAGAAYVWLPMLLVVALAAPSIGYLLPSYACYLGESYQPLRALRFFSSLGQDFHKYGPMTNLLLAPGYGLSLADEAKSLRALAAAMTKGESSSAKAGGAAPAIAIDSRPAPPLQPRTTPTIHSTIAAAAPAASPSSQSATGKAA